ncbi:MAG: Hpt domain-containing protein [Desulfuromonadales bacterium]|nr:Hpt domain-containing protein [Desulfuromonadales bacterium]
MRDKTDDFTNVNSARDEQAGAIDWSALDSLRVLQKPGKPDLRKQLMSVYLSSSPTLMDNIKTAVTTMDGQALMQAAHALKSSSVSIGAKVFGTTCSELEQLGRINSLGDVPALAQRAEYEFAAVCSAFREALQQND